MLLAAAVYKLAVRLTPRSGRDAVLGVKAVEGPDGTHADAASGACVGAVCARSGAAGLLEVQACVTAPPDNGKANKALCKLIASELGIAKSKVEVVQGQTSRHKRLGIAADAKLVDAWLSGLVRLD